MFLLSIAFFLLPFVFLDKTIKKNSKKILVICFSIILIFFGTVRWQTGTDWNSYYYFFLSATHYEIATQSAQSFELGYSLLNLWVNNTFQSYTAFLFIFTSLTVYLKIKVLTSKQFLSFSLLGFYIYYCMFIGDIVSNRQSLAISLTFFSLFFVIKRKLVPFLLVICLAMLIHRTAIIFIPAYFFYKQDFKQKTLMGIFTITMMLGVVLNSLDISMSNFSFLPGVNFLAEYNERANIYLEVGQTSYGSVDSSTSYILGYIKKCLIFIPIIILHRNNFNVYSRLLNITVVGSAIYFILGSMSSEFKRLAAYFDIIEMLVVPYYLYSIKGKLTKYTVIFIYCVMYFSKLYTLVINYWDLYNPFYTIFDSYINRNLY